MNSGAADGDEKAVLNVEVCLRAESQADLGLVKAAALAFLTSLSSIRYTEAPLAPPPGQHPLLEAHVQSMHVVDLSERVAPGKLLLQWDVAWNVSIWEGGANLRAWNCTPRNATPGDCVPLPSSLPRASGLASIYHLCACLPSLLAWSCLRTLPRRC